MSSTTRLKVLLVASDGERTAEAALAFARQLAARDGARVEVVAAYAPHIPVPPVRQGSPEHRCEPADAAEAEALRTRVARQAREHGREDWPVHLRVGQPSWMIGDLAMSIGADLILVGHRGEHTGLAPARTRHTAHQIALGCDVPVVCVPATHGRELPRVGVAIMDGTAAAERGAALAPRLLAPGAGFYRVDRSPGRALLPHLEALGAELVAVPVPGATFDVRALTSGGAADLLDHARCVVLVATEERASTTTDRGATTYGDAATSPSAPASTMS